jgi:hypothetical protein
MAGNHVHFLQFIQPFPSRPLFLHRWKATAKISSRTNKTMSDVLPNDWWETDAFVAGSTLPFGVAAAKDSHASDSTWEDLDGDIKLFLALQDLLAGERSGCWQHKRLDWDARVKKLSHENRLHI